MSWGLKPYPAYRDSGLEWLGRVPERWEVQRLKHAFRRIVGGSTPDSGDARYWDGDIVWVTPSDVSRTARLTDSLRHITAEGLSSCSTELVPPRSIIVTSRAPVGNVALAGVELCTNQGCKALVIDETVVDSRFALAALGTLKSELQSMAVGTTFSEVSATRLGTASMPVPPLGDQSAIVRYLGYVDRRIRRYVRDKQNLIELLREQKQSISDKAVTGQIDVRTGKPYASYVQAPGQWLGRVPEHWEVRRAKYCYREVDERSERGDEELLSVSHLTGVSPRADKTVTMFMAASYVGHKVCRPGDLVINTMWAWMGALGVSPVEGMVSPSYGVYRPMQQSPLLPGFADMLLRSHGYVAEYRRQSTGIRSSRLRLYPEAFLRIPLICPSKEEQREILAAVDTSTCRIDKAISAAMQETSRLREFRTRLVADVVTGKLDVREAAERLPEESEETESLAENDLLAEEVDEVEEEVVPEGIEA